MLHFVSMFMALMSVHKLSRGVIMKKVWMVVKLTSICVFVAIVCLSSSVITNYAVTTIAENAPISNRKCIIIDAGHGGVDSGAVSCTGIYESHLNLEIAVRLNDLMHLLGMKSVMIRKTDSDLSRVEGTIAERKISDLKERVRIINETDNAVLISIHQNIFLDSRYSGSQVFYAQTVGSKELALEIQRLLIAVLQPQNSRKIKRADHVYLMEHINCRGVLIECGFLSNPEEEAKLRSERYQKQICCVVAATLSKYLNT